MIDVLSRMVSTVFDTMTNIIDFFSKEYVIGSYSFTVFEWVLGAGLSFLLGFIIVKFITDIIP